MAWAAWQWFRPYEWAPDPAALAKINFSQVRRDRDYHWLDVRVRILDPARHDLSKGVALVFPDGREKRPDGLTLEGQGESGLDADGPSLAHVEAISFRFWMEPGDLSGPLQLQLNDGLLKVRSKSGPPELEDGETETFYTCRW
ncbi:hypothetical protein HAHE_34180 [Haloferula helveola]|uniref:LEA14-like dessication related protein n=1 Tax=Haloferula helveola TaxID=490095 RepID=A0ABM7RGX7_9BACT|nr:hypothetical protein HAHE_34180 [Haloferula helveola]